MSETSERGRAAPRRSPAKFYAALKPFRAGTHEYQPGEAVPEDVDNPGQLIHLGLMVEIPQSFVRRAAEEMVMADSDLRSLHERALSVAEAEAAALEDAEELAIKSGAAPPQPGDMTPARQAQARALRVREGLEAAGNGAVFGFDHPLNPLAAAPNARLGTKPETPEQEAKRLRGEPLGLEEPVHREARAAEHATAINEQSVKAAKKGKAGLGVTHVTAEDLLAGGDNPNSPVAHKAQEGTQPYAGAPTPVGEGATAGDTEPLVGEGTGKSGKAGKD